MNTIELKSNFHRLIDSIDNEETLSKFYGIMESVSKTKGENLWNRLTAKEKNELYRIDKETDNEKNLISHEAMKKKHDQWL